MEYSIEPKILGERRIIHYPQKRIIGLYVRNMLTLEYDEETARRVEREEAIEEGREEGRREGEQARRQLIISCLRKFKSCEVVADILDISVEEVQKIKDNM